MPTPFFDAFCCIIVTLIKSIPASACKYDYTSFCFKTLYFFKDYFAIFCYIFVANQLQYKYKISKRIDRGL